MMMKRTVTILMAVLMVCFLSGCGSGGQSASGDGEVENIRLMVWAPSEDQSKDSGEWLQKCCEAFAAQHKEYHIQFIYGVADEATAASTVAQDPESSADVFMYANDNLTVLKDAKAAAKFGGIYEQEIVDTNSETIVNSLRSDGYLYGVPFTTNTWYMFYDKSVFRKRISKILILC